MDLKLKDKVVVITGGTRGIGRMAALRFAEEGSRVAICGRSEDSLQSTLAELRALGVPAYGELTDVTRGEQVQRFVDNSARQLGGVDALVCSAGGSMGIRGILGPSDEDWQKVIDLNLLHTVRAVRSAVPHMQARGGGSVVMISSISGSKPAPQAEQYAAAKAGLIIMAGCLGIELAAQRIRVNVVSPGSTIFPGGGWERFKQNNPEAFAAFETQQFPWGRLGSPEEIADVIVFISSPRAGWINGANIPVDGLQGRPNAY